MAASKPTKELSLAQVYQGIVIQVPTVTAQCRPDQGILERIAWQQQLKRKMFQQYGQGGTEFRDMDTKMLQNLQKLRGVANSIVGQETGREPFAAVGTPADFKPWYLLEHKRQQQQQQQPVAGKFSGHAAVVDLTDVAKLLANLDDAKQYEELMELVKQDKKTRLDISVSDLVDYVLKLKVGDDERASEAYKKLTKDDFEKEQIVQMLIPPNLRRASVQEEEEEPVSASSSGSSSSEEEED